MRDVLAGRAVVVTGAGRGLGRAYVEYLGAAGADVVVNDLDEDVCHEAAAVVAAAGGTAIAHVADVSNWSEADELIERCVSEFGRIDGLVNNAGIVRLAKPWEETELNLRRIVEVNLLGTQFCSVHAVRRMLEQGSGAIVNVTSGSQAGWSLMGAYGSSKGGIASMTYCWAIDLAGTGVRINAISPVGETRLREHFAEYLGDAYTPKPGVEPALNAPAVAFLLSDASAALNGQVVRIDGPELSLVTHPSIAAPMLRREAWTFEDIVDAFDGELGQDLAPLGMVPSAARAAAPTPATDPGSA